MLDVSGNTITSLSGNFLSQGSLLRTLAAGTYFLDLNGSYDSAYTMTVSAKPVADNAGATLAQATPLGSLGAAPYHDFNGDGVSDLTWLNTSGLIYQWQMAGTSIAGGGGVTCVGSDWKMLGIADFSGTGVAGMLWQNTSGLVYGWQMDGGAIVGGGGVATVDSSWKLLTTRDFNGDGNSDLPWQNTSGLLYEWQMNGNQIVGSGSVGSVDPSQWKLLSAGDFNGDGKSDLLRQNTSGLIYEWQMNGSQISGRGRGRHGRLELEASWLGEVSAWAPLPLRRQAVA